ncbi:MAG: glycoside hydrolase family 57 [Planctomycetota bacterium]|nr:glycoside hydrolase family 57 [Planctomycetota bacterium]
MKNGGNECAHALGLHMHQPPGNLMLLIETNEWEARQIMLAYERPLRYAARFAGRAYFHVGFSGILLEQLSDPAVVERYRHIVDIPAMLRGYRDAPNIEPVGMGYYHPVFPLIPVEDWPEQIRRGREKVREVFGREPKGFWPPEMAFCMEMVPFLRRAGYEYVVVDGVHIRPLGGDRKDWYAPYILEYGGETIMAIPRDRDLSNAQQSGLDPSWFAGETAHKLSRVPRPALVTTWTDGENGGWFRQMDESAGFWGRFFAPYVEKALAGEMPLRPVAISDYLRRHPPTCRAEARTGAWNVGATSGMDLSQWAGSETQKKAIEEVWKASRRYHDLAAAATRASAGPDGGPGGMAGSGGRRGALRKGRNAAIGSGEAGAGKAAPVEAAGRLGALAGGNLDVAREEILRAETSCYLFWGDSWVPKAMEHVRRAHELMDSCSGGRERGGK